MPVTILSLFFKAASGPGAAWLSESPADEICGAFVGERSLSIPPAMGRRLSQAAGLHPPTSGGGGRGRKEALAGQAGDFHPLASGRSELWLTDFQSQCWLSSAQCLCAESHGSAWKKQMAA